MLTKNKILFSLLLGQLLTSTQVYSMPEEDDDRRSRTRPASFVPLRQNANEPVTYNRGALTTTRNTQTNSQVIQQNNQMVQDVSFRNQLQILMQESTRNGRAPQRISFKYIPTEYSLNETININRDRNFYANSSSNNSNIDNRNTTGARDDRSSGGGGVSFLGLSIGGGGGSSSYQGASSNSHTTSSRYSTHNESSNQNNRQDVRQNATVRVGAMTDVEIDYGDDSERIVRPLQTAPTNSVQNRRVITDESSSRSANMVQASNQSASYISDGERLELSYRSGSLHNNRQINRNVPPQSQGHVLGGGRSGTSRLIQTSNQTPSLLTEEEQIAIAIENSLRRQ